jgi:sorting and assembly machinery component 37
VRVQDNICLSDCIIDTNWLVASFRFSAFTESNGQVLVDLSLYVSSQNYYAGTSPAYGAILTWPSQWIIPPKLRKVAKARTEHLGLSSLDLEEPGEQRDRERSVAEAAGQIPKSLIRRPRETVSSLLGKTAQRNQFKLEALTAELFEPLQALLGNKTYLLSDERPSSLDVLALGYLSLALVPELPHSWLRNSLQTKTPQLAQYVERMRQQCFGVVKVSDAFDNATQSALLPWRSPERITAVKIGSTLLNALADAIPIVKDLRTHDRLREAAQAPDSDLNPEESKAVSEYAISRKRDVYVSVATVAAGVAALVGYLFHVGLITVDVGEAFTEEEEDEAEEYEGGNSLNLDGIGNASDFLTVL